VLAGRRAGPCCTSLGASRRWCCCAAVLLCCWSIVVRQLVGTTLGGLRHLVWTTFAPAERDHLVGGLPGSVS
jgi:hypothetical protein